MTEPDTVTLTRAKYDALLETIEDLEDLIAGYEVMGSPTIPDEVMQKMDAGMSSVRAWREHRSMSLAELATAAGMTNDEVAAIELGDMPADGDQLDRLAAALDATYLRSSGPRAA